MNIQNSYMISPKNWVFFPETLFLVIGPRFAWAYIFRNRVELGADEFKYIYYHSLLFWASVSSSIFVPLFLTPVRRAGVLPAAVLGSKRKGDSFYYIFIHHPFTGGLMAHTNITPTSPFSFYLTFFSPQ